MVRRNPTAALRSAPVAEAAERSGLDLPARPHFCDVEANADFDD